MTGLRLTWTARAALFLAALPACTGAPTGESRPVPPAGRRATFDRPAEVSGRQIHLIYMIPADGVDRGIDTNGVLDGSMTVAQDWLAAVTGKRLREDTWDGRRDISFLKSRRTDSEIAALGQTVLRTIYLEILDAGFTDRDTKYLVYYDGTHTTCGSATRNGPVAALYLRATTATRSCISHFATAGRQVRPGYWEFAALHEIVHMLGMVDPDARRHDAENAWHVRDGEDLMHGGGGAWIPIHVDRYSDSYNGPGVPPGIPNLAKDPILVPVAPGAAPATGLTLRVRDSLPAFPHDVISWDEL